MATTKDAQAVARDILKTHPKLKSELADILEMMFDEIADEGSEDNEAELAIRDMKDLVKDV